MDYILENRIKKFSDHNIFGPASFSTAESDAFKYNFNFHINTESTFLIPNNSFLKVARFILNHPSQKNFVFKIPVMSVYNRSEEARSLNPLIKSMGCMRAPEIHGYKIIDSKKNSFTIYKYFPGTLMKDNLDILASWWTECALEDNNIIILRNVLIINPTIFTTSDGTLERWIKNTLIAFTIQHTNSEVYRYNDIIDKSVPNYEIRVRYCPYQIETRPIDESVNLNEKINTWLAEQMKNPCIEDIMFNEISANV